MILGSSTQPSLLGSFLGLPLSWVIHVKQECSILVGSLGLETTGQPWTDWIGGLMKRDKARMKNLCKTQKLKARAESWVQAGWVCRDRVKERLAHNDQPGEGVSQSGGISPHWTWRLQHLCLDCITVTVRDSNPFQEMEKPTKPSDFVPSTTVLNYINRASVVWYSEK